MRPADETAACSYSEPQDSIADYPDSQGRSAPRGELSEQVDGRKNPTAAPYHAVILDASADRAKSLADALHVEGIASTAFQTKQKLFEFVEGRQVNLAVLVLRSKAWWKDELRLFCNSIRYLQEEPEPEILCILNWPPKDLEEESMNRVSGDALRVHVRHEW